MKITMIKLPGGVLAPGSDIEEARMARFKNNCMHEIEIKQPRNPAFHGKVFSFFNYCFDYWKPPGEYSDRAGQFDVFRKHLTCLSGYYESYYSINGDVRIEAKSISYGNMDQEEFEQFYHDLVQAAMKHIFKPDDQEAYNTLMGYL